MLIADTGPLVAMHAKDRHHEACTALFRRFQGPIIVPALIVTEVAYFLQIEPGPAVEARAETGHGARDRPAVLRVVRGRYGTDGKEPGRPGGT
jgi:hypothetical protein